MATEIENPTVGHKNEEHQIEEASYLEKINTDGNERAPEARGRDTEDVKKGYWFSLNFIGSMLAIGFA